MNKKFSTLLASALLATSVGAFAAPGYTTPASAFTAANSEILQSKYYMLGISGATNVVTVNQQADGTFALESITATAISTLAEADSALWTVTANTTGNGGVTRFVMTNKATGITFSFDPKNATTGTSMTTASREIGGVLTEWKWYDSRFNVSTSLQSSEKLTMDFHNGDSVLYVAQDPSGILYAKKETKKVALPGGAVSLQILQPGVWTLSAEDLNTKGDDVKYMQLSFAEDIDKNPFADKYQAQGMYAGATAPTGAYKVHRPVRDGYTSGSTEYVFLNKLNDNDELTYNYLRLDTSYYESTGASFKLYNQLTTSAAVLKKDANGDPIVANNYNTIDTLGYNLPDDAFRFKFTKDLLTDSLKVESFSQFVELANAVTPKNQKGNKVTYWTMLNNDARVDGSTLPSMATAPKSGVQNNTKLFTVLSHCTLVDEAKNVVTFYDDDVAAVRPVENYVNLWAHFGVDDDLASIADGLYKIQAVKSNEFWGVHIYEMDSLADYSSIDEDVMNLDHMPAFQWVVIKKDHSAARADYSPVQVTNREFAAYNDSWWQLRKGTKDGQYKLNGVEVRFIPVSDDARKDEYVGYKKLVDDELSVNRYTFNYLHPYTMDKYIALNADDSLMNVLGETPSRFIIKANAWKEYGYDASDAAAYIPDLAQLTRRSYTIEVSGGRKMVENKEHLLAMTSTPDAANDLPTTFFFKENNQTEKGETELCYYALIDTMGNVMKAGVTDNDLKAQLRAQVLSETRTSVFAIEKDDAPLYRRFNSAVLEGNAGDGPDTLRFVEKYRKEYLQVEANENFKVKGIDFLGIYTPDFTKDGKSFIVDTAFVNRWNGEIKPQYLISIDRQDQAFEAGDMCPVCQEIVANGGTRPANCPHDKAGKLPFHFGKYLVNFKDSVDADYSWKGYDRAGFVKAAHMGDSLYILTGQFADMTVATFDTAAIHKAVKDGVYDPMYIKNLQGDTHKTVTWSMRHVNPENAGNEVEEDRAFLLESLATNAADVIAPREGSWLKMQNGCLVMSGTAGAPSVFDEFTNDDDALIFNIEKGNKEDLATDNEEIATSEVTVIAQQGAVRVANAAGKKVVVTNILGQTVANTVITSSDATIAAPQGVVVVAVEGEEAVKAIVK
ncbi:DUF6383 domain-containing protein [Parabacteroides johnsonii]|jgi:hypothetical protein|uniref:DUF6383 domain-containing protein n=1 Tax=Parabacteroides johnsonii TaxID=387661 RepID=A0A9Q5SV39_9BACT|nr:DUF6383 domain-containing protein [Parabacteroides johnsonii]OUO07214.1 hypothetical protein B5F96_00645 [Parabacteroides johnsonii]